MTFIGSDSDSDSGSALDSDWRGGPGTEEFIYILVTVVEPGEPENPLLNPVTASRQEGAARSTGLQSHFILTSRASGCGATRGETTLVSDVFSLLE